MGCMEMKSKQVETRPVNLNELNANTGAVSSDFSTVIVNVKELNSGVSVLKNRYGIRDSIIKVFEELKEKHALRAFNLSYKGKVIREVLEVKMIHVLGEVHTVLEDNIRVIEIDIVWQEQAVTTNNKSIQFYSTIAKPVSNPFRLVMFNKTKRNIYVESFNEEITNFFDGGVLNDQSTYCCGGDSIFISGGEKDSTTLDNFSIINFLTKTVSVKKINLLSPRKNHSMLCLEDKFVIVVGGDSKIVELVNIEDMTVKTHSELNYQRIEPALIVLGDYLYAFNGFYTGMDSFERISLISDIKQWEIIKPNNNNEVFTQKFFAVSKQSDDSVIFLGGHNTNNMCYSYNTISNTISNSETFCTKFDFSDKFFYPFDEVNSFSLPNDDSNSLLRFTPSHGMKVIRFESELGGFTEEDENAEYTLADEKNQITPIVNN